MKTGPTIDKTALIETIRREYGLGIESLAFVPTGWVAHCYVANCVDGERYFLKLSSDSDQIPHAASDLDFYLPLTYQLCTKRILPHIACPVRTRTGQFTLPFEKHLLILFDFIEGETVGFGDLPDEILVKLARLVGILHKSTSQIELEHPFREGFGIAFEDDLVNSLGVLEGITSSDRWGKRELRKLLLPRQDEILAHLRRLKELRELAKATEKEMVVCHTDLHGGNLMADDEGNLYILDWENAMIAPPEHDLFFWAGYDYFWDSFLPIYECKFGPVSLDSSVFGFYYYRRNLEDLIDFVLRILYHNTGDEQDRENLYWARESCISGWPYLETTIAKIEAKLIQRQVSTFTMKFLHNEQENVTQSHTEKSRVSQRKKKNLCVSLYSPCISVLLFGSGLSGLGDFNESVGFDQPDRRSRSLVRRGKNPLERSRVQRADAQGASKPGARCSQSSV